MKPSLGKGDGFLFFFFFFFFRMRHARLAFPVLVGS